MKKTGMKAIGLACMAVLAAGTILIAANTTGKKVELAVDTTGADLASYDVQSVAVSEDGKNYVVVAFGTGFNPGEPIVLEILFDGKNPAHIVGLNPISHAETPGLGANMETDEFRAQFASLNAPVKTADSVPENPATGAEGTAAGEFDAIGAATISSKAIAKIVNNAYYCLNDQIVK